MKKPEGFTLIEILISLFLFIVVTGAALKIMMESMYNSSDTRNRYYAIGMAQSRVESLRHRLNIEEDYPPEIENGNTIQAHNGGALFYRKETIASVINNSGEISYQNVTVAVEWVDSKGLVQSTLVSSAIVDQNIRGNASLARELSEPLIESPTVDPFYPCTLGGPGEGNRIIVDTPSFEVCVEEGGR